MVPSFTAPREQSQNFDCPRSYHCDGRSYLFWKSADSADEHGKAAYAHTEAILAFGPRPAGSPGLQKAQAYISSELAKHGWSTMSTMTNRPNVIRP